MKMLASVHPSVLRAGDYCLVPDGELVYENPFVCDTGCGCETAFCGIDTRRATTTAQVVEVDVNLQRLAAGQDQWPYEMMLSALMNAQAAAARYPVGTVLRVHRHNGRWIYTSDQEYADRATRDQIREDVWLAASRAGQVLKGFDPESLDDRLAMLDEYATVGDRCPECDRYTCDMTVDERDEHIIRSGVVLVGCEGYYTPAFLAAYREWRAQLPYPRVNTQVRAGIDYSPDGPDAQELCLRCGSRLGERAVAVERDHDDFEFVCGDCYDDPDVMREALAGTRPAYQL